MTIPEGLQQPFMSARISTLVGQADLNLTDNSRKVGGSRNKAKISKTYKKLKFEKDQANMSKYSYLNEMD